MMEKELKIKLFIMITAITCFMNVSCSSVKTQQVNPSQESTISTFFKTNYYWKKEILPNIKTHPYISLKVTEVRDKDTANAYTYEIVRTKEYIAYLGQGELYYFDDSVVYMVDKESNELMKGKASGDYYKVFRDQRIMSNIEYYSFYFYPKTNYVFTCMRDTLIKSIPYKIMRYDKTNSHFLNRVTNTYDRPNFYTVDLYFNTQTRWVDYIHAFPMVYPGNEALFKNLEYIIHEVSANNKDAEMAMLFNFNNPDYGKYSRHQDSFLPYSWTWTSKKSENLTDTILHFPIVSITNDTTTIGVQKSWILLDFWFFGCRSCKKWLASLQREQDSLGFRILEHNDIRIFSINAITNNTERILEEVNLLHAEDIVYHAKGMGNLLNMSLMPQYYLISPDKKIVYKSNHLGDYSELLKAKADYERTQIIYE